jgi:hypothetical protein
LVSSDLFAELRDLVVTTFGIIGATVLKAASYVVSLYDSFSRLWRLLAVDPIKGIIGSVARLDAALGGPLAKLEKIIAALFKGKNADFKIGRNKDGTYNITDQSGKVTPETITEEERLNKDAAKYADFLKKTLQRMKDELAAEGEKQFATTWEKQLIEANKKADAVIKKYRKGRGEMHFNPADLEKLRADHIQKVREGNIKELQKEINAITFKNVTDQLRLSNDAAVSVYATVRQIRDTVGKEMHDKGFAKLIDGKYIFDKHGEERFQAALESSKLLREEFNKLRKTPLGMKNIQAAIDEIANSGFPGATEAVAQFQIQLNQVDAAAIVKMNKDMEKFKMDKVKRELRSTRDESKKIFNGLKADLMDLKEAAYQQLAGTSHVIKDEFGNITFPTEEGKAFFESMVEGSGKFVEALQAAKDNLRDLTHEMEDMKFDFAEDMFKQMQKVTPNFKKFFKTIRAESKETQLRLQMMGVVDISKHDPKLDTFKYQKNQISQLEKAAAKAANAGVDGWKRQLELLKQAYSIAKGMDTVRDEKYLKARMEESKAVMEQFKNATNSMNKKSKDDYKKAKVAYEKAKAGEHDQGLVQQQASAMQKLQKKILEVMETQKQGASDQLKDIEEHKTKGIEAWGSIKKATEEANKVAQAYGEIVTETGEKYISLGGEMILKTQDLTKAQSELNAELKKTVELQKQAASAQSSSNPSSAGASPPAGTKARGGPVTANTTYLVGEKGPELFTPGNSGLIIPNHDLNNNSARSSNRDVVDINLNIGGAEPITVQGDSNTLEKIQRALEDQKRYAA